MPYRMLAPDGVVYDVGDQEVSTGLAEGGVLYDSSDSFSFFNPTDNSLSKVKKSEVKSAISSGLKLVPSNKLVKMVGPDMRVYEMKPEEVSQGLAEGGNLVLDPKSLLINPNDPLSFADEKTVDNTGAGGTLSRPKNWLSAVGEVMDRPMSYLPYLNAVDVFESAKMYSAAKAEKNGTATPEQQAYLNAKLADAQREKTFGYKVMDIILRMPAYAIEFMTAGGAIKNLSKSAILKASGGQLKSMTDETASKLVGRLGLTETKDAAQTLASVKAARNTQDLTALVASQAGPEGVKRAKEISKKVVQATLDENVLAVPDNAGTAVANFFLRDTTSGVMNAANKMMAENQALQAAKKAGQSLSGLGISEATTKEAIKAAGASLAQAAAVAAGPRALFSAGRIANSVVTNMTPVFNLDTDDQGNVKRVLVNEGDDFWKAFAKAYGDMSIENFSESVGENFLFLKGAFGPQAKDLVKSGFLAAHQNQLVQKVTQALPPTTLDKANVAKRMVTNFLFGKNGEPGIVERMGFNGYFAELGEEAVGGVLRQALGITPIGLPSMEDVAAMAVGFALNPLAIGAVAYESANQVIAETTSKVMKRVRNGEAFRSAEDLAPVAEEIRSVAEKLSKRPQGFFDGILTSAFTRPYARAQARAIGRAFQPGIEGSTIPQETGLILPEEQKRVSAPVDVRETLFIMEALGNRIAKERARGGESGQMLSVKEILPDATIARILHRGYGVQFAAAEVEPELRAKLNDLTKRGLIYSPTGYGAGTSGREHVVLRAENGQTPLSNEEFESALTAYPWLGDVVDLTKNESITSRVRELLVLNSKTTPEDFLTQLLGEEEVSKLPKREDGSIAFDAGNPRLVGLMESIFYPESYRGGQVELAKQARSQTDMANAAQSTFYRMLNIMKLMPRDFDLRIGSTMVVEGTEEQISEALNKGYKDLESSMKPIRTDEQGNKVYRLMINGLNYDSTPTSFGGLFLGTSATRFGAKNPALAHEIMESILRYPSARGQVNTPVTVYAQKLLQEYANIAFSEKEDKGMKIDPVSGSVSQEAYTATEKALARRFYSMFKENPTELLVHQLEASLGLVSGSDRDSFSYPAWALQNRISLPSSSNESEGIQDVFKSIFELKEGPTPTYNSDMLDKLLKELGAIRTLAELNEGGLQGTSGEVEEEGKTGKFRKKKKEPVEKDIEGLRDVDTSKLRKDQARYEEAPEEVKQLVQQIISTQEKYGKVFSDQNFYYLGGKKEKNQVKRQTVLSTQAAGLRTEVPSKAGELGTEFHNIMSQILSGVEPVKIAETVVKLKKEDPAYQGELDKVTAAIDGFRTSLARNFDLNPSLWVTEQFLSDSKRRAAGTIDAIYFNPKSKKFEIYDWKTLLGVPWDEKVSTLDKVSRVVAALDKMKNETEVRDSKEMASDKYQQSERQALKFKYQISGYADLLSQLGLPVSRLSDSAFIVPVARMEKDLEKTTILDYQITNDPFEIKIIPDAITKLTAEVAKYAPKKMERPERAEGTGPVKGVTSGVLDTETFDLLPTYNLVPGKVGGVYDPDPRGIPVLAFGKGAYEDESVFGFGPRTAKNSKALDLVFNKESPAMGFKYPTKIGEIRQVILKDQDIETGEITNLAATQKNFDLVESFVADPGPVLFPNGLIIEKDNQFLGISSNSTLEEARDLINRFQKGELKVEKKPAAPAAEGTETPAPTGETSPSTPPSTAEVTPATAEIKTILDAIVSKNPRIKKDEVVKAIEQLGEPLIKRLAGNPLLLNNYVSTFTLDPGTTPQASLSSLSYSFEDLPDKNKMQEIINNVRGDIEKPELIRELSDETLNLLKQYLNSSNLKKAYVVANELSLNAIWSEDTISEAMRAAEEADFLDLTGERSNSPTRKGTIDDQNDDYYLNGESREEEDDYEIDEENQIFVTEIQQRELGRQAISNISAELGLGRGSYVRVYNWFQSPLVRNILDGTGGINEEDMLSLLQEDALFKNDKYRDDKEVRLKVVEHLSKLKRLASERGITINLRDRWVTSALSWTDITRTPYSYARYTPSGEFIGFEDIIANRSRMIQEDVFRHLDKMLGQTDEEARENLRKKVIGEGGKVDEKFKWRQTVPNTRLARMFSSSATQKVDNRGKVTKITLDLYDQGTGQLNKNVEVNVEEAVSDFSDLLGISPTFLYSGFHYGDNWLRNFYTSASNAVNKIAELYEPNETGASPISGMSKQEIMSELFNILYRKNVSAGKTPFPALLYQISSQINLEKVPEKYRNEAKEIFSTPQDHIGAGGKRKSGVRGRMLITDELDLAGFKWRILDHSKRAFTDRKQEFDGEQLNPDSIDAINRFAFSAEPEKETYWQWYGRGGDSDIILQVEVERAMNLPQLKDLRKRAESLLEKSGYTKKQIQDLALIPSEEYIESLRGKEPKVIKKETGDRVSFDEKWYFTNSALSVAILQASTVGSPYGTGAGKESTFPKRLKSGFTPGFRPVVGVEGGLGETYNELLIDFKGFEDLVPPEIDGFDLLANESKWHKSYGDIIALGRSVGGTGKWAMMKPIHSQRDNLRKSSVGLLEFLAETQPDSLYGALNKLVQELKADNVGIEMVRITTSAKLTGKNTKVINLSDLVSAKISEAGDVYTLKDGAKKIAKENVNSLRTADFKIVLDPRSEIEPESGAVPIQLVSTFMDGTGGEVVEQMQEISAVIADQFNQSIEEALTGKLVTLREVTNRYLRDSGVTDMIDAAIEKYGTSADYRVLSPVTYDRISDALRIFASEYASRPILNGLHSVNTPSGAKNDSRVSTEKAVRWNNEKQEYETIDSTKPGYKEEIKQDNVEMRMARVLTNVGDGRAATIFRTDHLNSLEAVVFAGLEILQNPEKYADLYRPGMYLPTELTGIIMDSERAKSVTLVNTLIRDRNLEQARKVLNTWVQMQEIDVLQNKENNLFSSVIPSQPVFWMRVPASSGAATGYGRVSAPIAGGESQLIMSYEDSKKAGADHDGDKWFVYTLVFDSKGGLIVPKGYTGRFNTRGEANRTLLAMTDHFYSNKESHLKRYEPIDIKYLDDLVAEELNYEQMVEKTKETPERAWAFGPVKQLENLRQSQVGEKTRGIFAANNRVYKAFMHSGQPWLSRENLNKLSEALPKQLKEDLYSFTKREDGNMVFEGKRTADSRGFRLVIGSVDQLNTDVAPKIIDTFLQLSVDNDKERKIPLLGINRENAPVVTSLLMMNPELHKPGVTKQDYINYLKEVVKFLKHAEVKKFYELLDNRNTPTGRIKITQAGSAINNPYEFPLPPTSPKALYSFLMYGPHLVKAELKGIFDLLNMGRLAIRSGIQLQEKEQLFTDALEANDIVRARYPNRRNTAAVQFTGAIPVNEKEELDYAEHERRAIKASLRKEGNAVLIYLSDVQEPNHSPEVFYRLSLRKSLRDGADPIVTDEFFEENVRKVENLLNEIQDLQREVSGINVPLTNKEVIEGGLTLVKLGDSGISRLESIAETAPRTYNEIRSLMDRFGRISRFKLVNASNLFSLPNGELNEYGRSIEKFLSVNRNTLRYSPENSRVGQRLLTLASGLIDRSTTLKKERELKKSWVTKRLMSALIAQSLPEDIKITDSTMEMSGPENVGQETGTNYRLARTLKELQKKYPTHPLYSSLLVDEKISNDGKAKRPVIVLIPGYTISKSMDEMMEAKNEIRNAIIKSEVNGKITEPVPAEFLSDLYAVSVLEFGLDTVGSSQSDNPLRLLPLEVGEIFAQSAWEELNLWNTSSLEYENEMWDNYISYLLRPTYLPSVSTYQPAVGYSRMVRPEQGVREQNLDALSMEQQVTSHKVSAGLPSSILELSTSSGVSLNQLKERAIMANRASTPGGSPSTRTVRPEFWQVRIQNASNITNEEQANKYAQDNNAKILDGTGKDTFVDTSYDYTKPGKLPYGYISLRQPRPYSNSNAIEQGKKSTLVWTPSVTDRGESFIIPPVWLTASTEEKTKRRTFSPAANPGDLIRIKTVGPEGQTVFKYLQVSAIPEEIDYLIPDLVTYRPGKNLYPRFETLPTAERLQKFQLSNLKVRPPSKFILPRDNQGRPLSISFFFPGAGVVASEVAVQYKDRTAAVVYTPLVNTVAPSIENSVGEELKVPFEVSEEKLRKIDEEALSLLAWSSDAYLDKRLGDWSKQGNKLNALPYQKKIAERIDYLKTLKFNNRVRREMAVLGTAADATSKVRSAFIFAGKGKIINSQFLPDTEGRVTLENLVGLLIANSEFRDRGINQAIPTYVYSEDTGKWYAMPLTSTGVLREVEESEAKISGDHFIFGSSNLSADGKLAVEKLFERSFNEPKRPEEEPEGPTEPVTTEPQQPGTTVTTTGFLGYRGGFENVGKGTPQGDGKDKAMREVADSAIVELASNRPSSSKTSLDKLGTPDENSSVIMLARNGELRGKPLKPETIASITDLVQNLPGVQFVVGDMPGVDSQFVDLLRSLGATFEIYHTGATSRIQVPTPGPQASLRTMSSGEQVDEADRLLVQQLIPALKASGYNVVERPDNEKFIFDVVTKVAVIPRNDEEIDQFIRGSAKELSIIFGQDLSSLVPPGLTVEDAILRSMSQIAMKLKGDSPFSKIRKYTRGATRAILNFIDQPVTEKQDARKNLIDLYLNNILLQQNFREIVPIVPENLVQVTPEKALTSKKTALPLIEAMNQVFKPGEFGVTGSAAYSRWYTIYRPKEGLLHDLDIQIKKVPGYENKLREVEKIMGSKGYDISIGPSFKPEQYRFLVSDLAGDIFVQDSLPVATTVAIQNIKVPLVHPSIGLAAKLKWGRPKDLQDRRMLAWKPEFIQKPSVQASLSNLSTSGRITTEADAALKGWPEDFRPKDQQEASIAFLENQNIAPLEKVMFDITKNESTYLNREKVFKLQNAFNILKKNLKQEKVDLDLIKMELMQAGFQDPQLIEIERQIATELSPERIEGSANGIDERVLRFSEYPISPSNAGNVPQHVRNVLSSGIQAQLSPMRAWMDARNPFIDGAAEDRVFQKNLDLSNLVMQIMWDEQTELKQTMEILGINGDYIRVLTQGERDGKVILETNMPTIREKNRFALSEKISDADRYVTTEFLSALTEFLSKSIGLTGEEIPSVIYGRGPGETAQTRKKPFGITWADVLLAEKMIKEGKKEFPQLNSFGTVLQGLGSKVLNRPMENVPDLMKYDKELFDAGKQEIYKRLLKEAKVIWGRKGPMDPVFKKDKEGKVELDDENKPQIIGYEPKEGDEETVGSIFERWKNSNHYRRLISEGNRNEEILSLQYWAERINTSNEDIFNKLNKAHEELFGRSFIKRKSGYVARESGGLGILTPEEERWLFARLEEINSNSVPSITVEAFKKSRYDARNAFNENPLDLQKKIYKELSGNALGGKNKEADADEKIYALLWAELGKELIAFRKKEKVKPNEGLKREVDGINLEGLFKYLKKEIMPIINSPVNTRSEFTRQFNTWNERSRFTGELPSTLDILQLKQRYARNMFNFTQLRLVISTAVTGRDMSGRPMAFIDLLPEMEPDTPGAIIPPSVLSTMVNNWVEYLKVSNVDYTHNFRAPLTKQIESIARLLDSVAPNQNKATEGLSGYERFGEGNIPGIKRIYATRGAVDSALKMVADREYQMELSLFGRDIDFTRGAMDIAQITKMSAVSFSLFFPLAGIEQQIGYWGQFPQAWLTPNKFMGSKEFLYKGTKVKGWLGFVRALFNRTDPDINRLISDFTRQGLVLDLSRSVDVHLAQLENFMKRMTSWLRIEGKGGRKALLPVEYLLRGQLKYSNLLFSEFFPMLKMHGAYLIYKQTEANYKQLFGRDWSEKERKESIKWIAQQMNDGFGGQNWSSYKFATPKVMQLMNLSFFAFNWTMSTANTMGFNVVLDKLGLGPEIGTPQMRQMILANTLMFGVALMIWPNILQSMIYASFGDPDEKDKVFTLQNEQGRQLYVDITPIMRKMSWYTGDQTGERRYYVRWGKQIYEVVDGWLTDAKGTFLRKMSLPAQFVYEQMFGTSPGSDFALPFKDAGLSGIFWTQEEGFMGSRLANFAGYVLPFSVQAISGSTKEAALFGTFASVSKGRSKGAATEELIKVMKTYGWPSVWEEMNTSQKGKENLRALANEVIEAAERNGYPTSDIINDARSAVLGDLYKRAIKAMDEGDFDTFDKFAKGILRVNGTAKGLMQSIASGKTSFGKPKLDITPEMENAIREAFNNP